VSRYQKGKTNLDFSGARDSEWQWHQLGHMQVCTSLQTNNHTSTPPLSFLQAGCFSCRPTNSVTSYTQAQTSGQSNMTKGRIAGAPLSPKKLPLPLGRAGLRPNTRPLGPTRVHTANDISIGSAVFVEFVVMSNRRKDTDRPRNIGSNRPHLCTPYVRCGLLIPMIVKLRPQANSTATDKL